MWARLILTSWSESQFRPKRRKPTERSRRISGTLSLLRPRTLIRARSLRFVGPRQIDGVGVHLEFFCPVGAGEPGKLLRNPGANIGSKISAIRTRGAELAAMDYVLVPLAGELLDHGGVQGNVNAKVANLLPFLVLKAFAIDERDKAKDSYDVVWTLNAYKDGPRSAIENIAKSPVVGHPGVKEAMERLRAHFQTPEHRGPSQYANFELTAVNSDDARARLRRHAHGTLAEFFRLWRELRLPG